MIYFILGVLCIALPVFHANSAAGENLLFFGDFESGQRGDRPAEFWHRAGQDFAPAYPDWRLSADLPVGGKFCITTATQKEFVVGGECGGGKVAASVMLRADRPAKALLRLSWWSRRTRVDETREVPVRTTWERHEISTLVRQEGPIELAVSCRTPDARLWADEFQAEGNPMSNPMAGATHRVSAAHLPDLARHLADLQLYDGAGRDSKGAVRLRIEHPPQAVPIPMVSGGVPFPKGKLFRPEKVRVTDDSGREVPYQIEVLARWCEDRSVKVLLVTIPAQSKGREFNLEFGPDIVPKRAVEGIAPAATFAEKVVPAVTDGEGRIYHGRILSMQQERRGPLVGVTLVRGELRSSEGKRLGRYVTRCTGFGGSALLQIAHSWVNDESAPFIQVQSAWLDLPALKPPGEAASASGILGALAVRDFAENQPLALSGAENGYRAWLWPESAKGVLWPQGLARQWEFLLDTSGAPMTTPFRTQSLPLLHAGPEWMCGSGVFEFILPPDPKTFPIFERRVSGLATLGGFSWEAKEKGKLFGLFNFGDAPGDGGWANLESMADHELFLHWMRTLSREHFDMARLAAEHYRDVDIHHGVGFCHTHCNDHTSSSEEWSHAWVQGVRDLYFLIGDLRALEVLYEVGECLLTKEVGWTSGRDWTRPIDNLVDIYGATGDPRFLECVKRHIVELGRRQDSSRAVCGAERGSWYEDRYPAGCAFTWYGCQAMAKLHYETGDVQTLDILRREMDLSLDVQTKALRARDILPGEKIGEDRRAYVLANPFALGRGSTIFSPLGYLAEATKDKRYLNLGMKILAHYMLNLRGGSDASATSYATVFLHYARNAGLGPADEAAAYERARQFSFEQWPRGLVNGGFEEGFRHWEVKRLPGQNFYYDNLVKLGYYLDEAVKRSGRQSLRLHSDNRGRLAIVKGSFGLKPMTRWRASIWVKGHPSTPPGASVSLREYDTDASAAYALRPTGKGDGDWEERAAEFMTVNRTVATWSLVHAWSHDAPDNARDAWFDDAALEELGPAEFLLTNNGGGRDWRAPAYGGLNLDLGGAYTPDEPMTGDAKAEGAGIPFTIGCLTDGVSKYDYQQKPLASYAYWQGRESGSLTFTWKRPCKIRRVRVNVLNNDARKAHGTERIELLHADRSLGVIEHAEDGWNEFGGLDLVTDHLILRFTRMSERNYLTISEVEVWGYAGK